MEITRDRAAGTIQLSNQQATQALLSQHSMSQCKPSSTPLPTGVKLQADDSAPAPPGYSNLVGSLLYLSITTRPDIAQAVGALARYMSKLTVNHFNAAKHVIRYLAGTVNMGIVFAKGDGSISLFGYCDADYAGSLDNRRSTTGYCFLCNDAIISWSSRLQQTVAVSTAEAEYMAAAAAVKEALWLQHLCTDMHLLMQPTTIYSDNQAALSLLRNPTTSQRSKHIDILYHFARERAADGDVNFVYCNTSSQLADALTKPLSPHKFQQCVSLWGLS